MKKNVGVRAVGAQAVREILEGKWMLLFVALTIGQFALVFGARMISGINPISFIIYTMMEGFVTAEVLILRQKKESRNMRHLSVYSLVMAVVMLTLFVGLSVVVVSVAMSKDALPQDMLEEWTRDYESNFPKMILSTVLTGVTGVQYIFLRLTLKQGAEIMDRKRTERDWRLPAAILTALVALLSMAEEALSPLAWTSMLPEIVGFIRNMTLAILLFPGTENR